MSGIFRCNDSEMKIYCLQLRVMNVNSNSTFRDTSQKWIDPF